MKNACRETDGGLVHGIRDEKDAPDADRSSPEVPATVARHMDEVNHWRKIAGLAKIKKPSLQHLIIGQLLVGREVTADE
jgi:hypothetical protein